MSYQYGSPVAQRPICWAKSYDSDNRECRSCGFNHSCKEAILRNHSSLNPVRQAAHTVPVQPATSPSLYQPYSAVPTAPATPQQYGSPGYQVPSIAPSQPQPPAVQPSQTAAPVEHYGRIHDPLYWTIAATPPPVRTQMEGETFGQRMFKNMILRLIETFFAEGFLAVRQMVLPPVVGGNSPGDYPRE